MNTNTNTNTPNVNVLPIVKKPTVFYITIALIIFLIIGLFLIIFKVKIPFKGISKSNEQVVADTLIILFFILFILGICFVILPNFKEISTLFQQISSVTYVIIYTISLILLFTLTPSSFLDKYAKYITPATAIIGAILFYKSITTEYISNFSINYERIKTMIIMFCLIAVFIIYYNLDPGKYIQKYLGTSFFFTIILSIFAFLYLIILLSVSDKASGETFLNSMSTFGKLGTIAFIIFLIVITILITTYPGGFFADKVTASSSMIILLMIFILSSILFIGNMFPETYNNSIQSSKLSMFKRSLLILFGLIISGLLVYWIVYNIQNLSGQSSIISFVLNILIVLVVVGLIYKTMNVKSPVGNSNKNGFFDMITNTLLYIPCLFSGLFDSLGSFMVGQQNDTNMGSFMMLGFAIVLIVSYFELPKLVNKFNIQGGKQLVNNPVYTDTQYSLGTYEELNGTTNFDYQYAISFWVFIDASTPNSNKYTSLLNFGEKPNIMYNGTNNSLMITMQQKDLKNTTNNKLIDFDENGNRIIYKNDNVLLQKWNNIVINYSGGIFDIFLNGELVKSDIGVVPYYTMDNLTIGEENGIKGGICNVVYFSKALNASNIYYLYNMVKNVSPPILNDSNLTILKEDIKITNDSFKKNLNKL